MADKPTSFKYATLLDHLLGWQESVVVALTQLGGQARRMWCWLGSNQSVTNRSSQQLFERKILNDQYVTNYNQTDDKPKPYSYLQAEINLIYGLHKCFVERHKSRLQYYREDACRKRYRQRQTVIYGWHRYITERQQSESGEQMVWLN